MTPLGLITPEEAAILLEQAVATLASWRAKKFGPKYIKTGRKVRYDPDDIMAWVMGQKVDPEEVARAASTKASPWRTSRVHGLDDMLANLPPIRGMKSKAKSGRASTSARK